jgi:hypothetical protein
VKRAACQRVSSAGRLDDDEALRVGSSRGTTCNSIRVYGCLAARTALVGQTPNLAAYMTMRREHMLQRDIVVISSNAMRTRR